MPPKSFFYIAILTLMLLGIGGVVHIGRQNDGTQQVATTNTQQQVAINQRVNDSEHQNSIDIKLNSPTTSAGARFESILQLINAGQPLEAANSINQHYSNLSRDELNLLKSAFLAQAFNSKNSAPSITKNILLATSKAFDDLDVWKHLGDVAASNSDWSTAFSAHLRASELENNSTDLELLLDKLVVSSSHVRSNFEGSGDLLSIKNLYQRLSDLHPNFQRFKYELAVASIALDEIENAQRLLELLVYDLELGEVAQKTLAQIQPQETPESDQDQVAKQKPKPDTRANDIVVPLIASGSSFIIDSTIERAPVRLLLDTGASITSLSTALVSRLNLEPTGQEIRLSTANGITRARVYKVKQLRLGSLVLRDMLIAEINLSSNRSFQGLLGTDALNQLKPQYNYLIDNQKRALIFRKQ